MQICFKRKISSNACCRVTESPSELSLISPSSCAIRYDSYCSSVNSTRASLMSFGGKSFNTASFVRRRMCSPTSLLIWLGRSPELRYPGERNSKIPTKSSAEFSTGVPVKAQLRRRGIALAASDVAFALFLIRCDSSKTARSKVTFAPPGGS